MKELPIDPVNWLGTPEYMDQAQKMREYREMMLDIMQEEHDAEMLQFPYRHTS